MEHPALWDLFGFIFGQSVLRLRGAVKTTGASYPAAVFLMLRKAMYGSVNLCGHDFLAEARQLLFLHSLNVLNRKLRFISAFRGCIGSRNAQARPASSGLGTEGVPKQADRW